MRTLSYHSSDIDQWRAVARTATVKVWRQSVIIACCAPIFSLGWYAFAHVLRPPLPEDALQGIPRNLLEECDPDLLVLVCGTLATIGAAWLLWRWGGSVAYECCDLLRALLRLQISQERWSRWIATCAGRLPAVVGVWTLLCIGHVILKEAPIHLGNVADLPMLRYLPIGILHRLPIDIMGVAEWLMGAAAVLAGIWALVASVYSYHRLD